MKVIDLANEIIDIIGNENTDWKSIVLKLAKKDPKTLYAIVKGDDEEEFRFHVYDVYLKSNKNKKGPINMVCKKYGVDNYKAFNYVKGVINEYEYINDTETK